MKIVFSRKMILQKQPSRGVFIEGYSENMQQINRRTPMPMFCKAALLIPNFGMDVLL